jgi:signal transduction histidine kinase
MELRSPREIVTDRGSRSTQEDLSRCRIASAGFRFATVTLKTWCFDVELRPGIDYNSAAIRKSSRHGSTHAMLSLKGKLRIGMGLVLAMVATLTASSLWAILSYRTVIANLDQNLNRVPQRRELIEAFAALLDPLQTALPNDGRGRAERLWQFEQRLAEAERRTGDALRKLAELPPYPQWRNAREVASNRLWEIDQRLRELRRDQRLLLEAEPSDPVNLRLLRQVGKLQAIAAGLPEFGSGLRQVLDASRETYRVSFWWVVVSTGLVVMLLMGGWWAAQRWISRPWKRLLEGTHRIAQGRFEFRVKLETRDEFAELADSFNRMADCFLIARDRLQQDARELAEQLHRQERLAGLGFLASGIAHEINNPLTAIRWTSESLLSRSAALFSTLNPKDSAAVTNYLKMIQAEATRCQQITAKLLDFARGGDSLRTEQDLTQIVREVIQLVRAMSKYRQCEIVFERTEPCWAIVNGNEIKQVVLNLVANALDAIEDAANQVARRPRLVTPSLTHANAPTSTVAAPAVTTEMIPLTGRLEIRLQEFPDHVELSFQDNGCGMSAETLRRIFDPFFTTKPSGEGTGLGLPVCHRIATEHGGRIAASSPGPGKGSTFRLSLPRQSLAPQKVA